MRADAIVAYAIKDDAAPILSRYARHRHPGDLDELVRRYRPLARSIAARYVRTGEGLEDLEQVANVGLVKALQRYDPERGFAFSSFAVPTILGEVKRHIRDTRWAAHVPRSLQERSARIRAASESLERSTGRPPTLAQLTAALGDPEEDVIEGLTALGAMSATSTDAPATTADDGDVVSLGDSLGQEDDGFARVEEMTALRSALPALTPPQRTVIELRFGEDLKQSEIARRVGVSQMQVSRLLRSGLERLQTVAEHQSAVPGRAGP